MYQQWRSLTFVPSSVFSKPEIGKMNANAFIYSAGLSGSNTFGTINTTNFFNKQFNEIMATLTARRDEIQQKVNEALAKNPHDTSNRGKGVILAWLYEKWELIMGGKGTADWTDNQIKEIIEKGSARGAEMHHINNVADHPKEQGNPDNIQATKSREEHQKLHNGDFRNKTEGSTIDRDKRLKDANTRRVFKNELSGLGIAAAIGFGTGFTIGFIVTLAQSGVSPENIRNAAVGGSKAGLETMSISIVDHLITRGIGGVVSSALQGYVGNLGFEVTENIIAMCDMATIGIISICIFSIYQFTRLKIMGYDTKECVLRTVKQAAFSLSVLAVSIMAQGIWGGVAGIIVSISIGLIVISYKVFMSIHDKQLLEEIRIYTIEKTYPCFGSLNYALS